MITARTPAAVFLVAGAFLVAGEVLVTSQRVPLVGLAQVLAGLVLLVKGADVLVRGAVLLGRQLGLSPFFIGLTVVAFGTSAPELATSIQATLKQQGEIAIGNVIGSNVANLWLILAITALVRPVPIDRRIVRYDVPLLIVLTAAASVTLLDGFFARAASGAIGPGLVSQLDGLLLVLGLAAYVVYNYRTGRIDPEEVEHEVEVELGEDAAKADRSAKLMLKSLAYVLLGLFGLAFGSHLLVGGSTDVAEHFGVPEFVIGMTLVAIGTSVPELAFSVRAAQGGHPELVLGNVLGSNAFNILCVLGISGLVDPIQVPAVAAQRDVWIMLLATALIWPMMITRQRVSRAEAVTLLVLYAGYMAFVVGYRV